MGKHFKDVYSLIIERGNTPYMTEKTEQTFIPISDNVRMIVLAYATRVRWPKAKITNVETGVLDNEPLMQAFASLEKLATGLHDRQMEDISKRVEETATAYKTESAFNRIYHASLKEIIKRAKGSLFGKGKDITQIAENAINQVEGPYH